MAEKKATQLKASTGKDVKKQKLADPGLPPHRDPDRRRDQGDPQGFHRPDGCARKIRPADQAGSRLCAARGGCDPAYPGAQRDRVAGGPGW